MSTITAIIHTRNSESTLKACLKSVQWCDVVMVVDMDSADATIEIAKQLASKIYHVKLDKTQDQGMIVERVRNEFLQKVTTDWTLIVDSDEEVQPALATKIKEVMLTEGVMGYYLPRRNLILGKAIEHSGFWPDYLLRLFRSGKARQPLQIHTQPVVEGKVEYLPAQAEVALLHHHYETITEFISRMNTYTSEEVTKLLAQKESYSPLDAITAFFAQFQTRYFSQQGYKDGSYGLALSLLLATYSLVAVLKAWEVKKLEVNTPLVDVETEIEAGCQATAYWVANEQIKAQQAFLPKLMWRLRRKLSS